MHIRLLLPIFSAALFAQLAGAQPFSITAQFGSTTSAVPPGGTLNVAAPAIGSPLAVRLTVSYRGGTTVNITGVDRTGSNDFSSLAVPTPLQLAPGASFTTTVTYTPVSGQPAQAQLAVSYLEDKATAPSTFSININGTVPDLVYAYAFSGGNAQAVADGALIQFPTTPLTTIRTANFTVLNRGSGPGTISNITLTGDAFQLGGLQIPPYTISPNGALSFTIAFAPTDRTTQTGSLGIAFAGRTNTFKLQGTGTSAVYLYTVVRPDGTTAVVQPGQAIAFPDTNTGATSPLTLRIANNGNGPGLIPAISISGPGYQLTSTPFLPVTLPIGAQTQLTLSFTPATPGDLNGGLKIGDDTFTLAGTGIGPAFTYNYAIGGSATSVTPGGSILFSPSKVGETGLAAFTLTNTGNAPAAVNSIFLTGPPVFTLAGLPGLPLNLAPGASATFTVRFAPSKSGVSQGGLQVGAATFTLSGSAADPDPLPPAVITGPTGTVQPLQQPAFKLSLRQPYAIDVAGTLAIAFNSAVFTADPSVQFASGGKTADFLIRAGTTSAIFVNNSDQIAIQTGTVAGAISIAAAFATTTGLDLTPANPPVLTLTVAQLAPQITGLGIANQTAAGFTLAITGYSTSRSVTQIALTAAAAAGQSVTNSSVTIPADSAFQAWYQTPASQGAGSSFTALLPITLTGNSAAPATLTRALQSVSVTLTNAQGTSAPQSVSIPQ